MIGALVISSACIIEAFDGWETSIMRPTRFISAITCFPNGESPFHFQPVASPVFESDS